VGALVCRPWLQSGRLAVAIAGLRQHAGTVPNLGVDPMLAVPTRGVLIPLGRSALGSTVKASGLGDPALAAAIQRVFDRMAAEVEWPDQFANQVYLVEMVLPVASFYTALREQGWDQPEAVRTVHHAFLATGDSQRRLFVLLMGTRLGAGLFLRTLRPNWLGLTPAPANQWAVTRPERGTVKIEVSRCYRLDAFRHLGIPEVAFIACYFEGYVMDASPFIRVTWQGMATGAERCHCCFELLGRDDRQPVNSDRFLSQPAVS
jgi:hypothetical protein